MRRQILTPATAWTDLEDMTLGEVSQTQKRRIPVIRGPERSHTHRGGRRPARTGGWKRGRRVLVKWGRGSLGEDAEGWGWLVLMISSVNMSVAPNGILNA